MKEKTNMMRLRLFIVYSFTWIILSGAKIEVYPFIFIVFITYFTPYVFQLNYHHISIKASFKLLLFFCYYSLQGGIQVALFALQPRLKLNPFVYEYPIKEHNDLSVSILANIYSLMPGTVSMGYNNQRLTLHILDKSLFDLALIKQFDTLVLELFPKRIDQ